MKYQIKSDKGYYSRSMSTGKAIFLDSSEMGYTFTKEDAERMLDRLEKETGKDLEIVEYKSYYDDGGTMSKGGMAKLPNSPEGRMDKLIQTLNEMSESQLDMVYDKYDIQGDLAFWVISLPNNKVENVLRYSMSVLNDKSTNRYADGGVMAKGGQIYNFDVVLYNDDENYTIKEKKRYQVKASNRSKAYDKAKTKYPKPYFVELYSVDNYADGGMMADGGNVSDTIAMTILKQLGGINKLVAMTGAYNFVDLGNGVSFKIKNQKANYIKITLNSMDLYDLEVGRIRADTYKVITTHKDVYFDQLKPLIEKATGMYLSLFANGGNVQEENDVFDAYVPPTPEEKAAQQQKKAEIAKMAMMFIKDGAEIPYDKLYELDIDKLDMYEKMRYENLINKGISKEDTINVLINDVEGDYSQLSPELNKYLKWYKTYYWRKGSRKSKFAYGGITEEMKAAKNILGDSWNRMSEDEKLNATKYLIRKGQIEGGREEYQYDNYPYAKGGRVRFQDKVDAISSRLEGTKVPKRLRKDYGATYDKKESEMAAKRIAGSMIKK